VDFASLMGTSMMISSASVPARTYSQAVLTLSDPQVAMYSPGTNGMGYGMMNSTLASSSVTVTLNPPLEVAADASTGMMLDMSLLQSVLTNNGAVTGTINPTFVGSGMSDSADGIMMQGLGAVMGIVLSVSTTGSESAFTGSFTLQHWMMGRSFTVNVTAQTTFQGVSSLSGLTSGTFVEVQGSVDSSGNVVASQVDAEGETNSQESMGSFVGVITSLGYGASGNATQVQMGMNYEFPDMRSMMGLFSQPQVTLVPTATYQLQDPAANFAQLKFDSTTLGPGQLVTVLGQVTGSNGGGMSSGGGMMGAAQTERWPLRR
jgi:hypothetical protein